MCAGTGTPCTHPCDIDPSTCAQADTRTTVTTSHIGMWRLHFCFKCRKEVVGAWVTDSRPLSWDDDTLLQTSALAGGWLSKWSVLTLKALTSNHANP